MYFDKQSNSNLEHDDIFKLSLPLNLPTDTINHHYTNVNNNSNLDRNQIEMNTFDVNNENNISKESNEKKTIIDLSIKKLKSKLVRGKFYSNFEKILLEQIISLGSSEFNFQSVDSFTPSILQKDFFTEMMIDMINEYSRFSNSIKLLSDK